jgi:hypothetical protein
VRICTAELPRSVKPGCTDLCRRTPAGVCQPTVYNDVMTTVYNDVNTTLANDISALRSSTVQNDQTGLSNLGLPGTPGASAAISAAQSTISSAISTANADIDHANGDLDAAYQVADTVGTGSCAGDGPGQPPSGVSHLS